MMQHITYGRGDVPVSCALVHVLSMRMPCSHASIHASLSSLSYTVFGLGDSSYPIYNAVARRLHQRLLDLHATCIHPRGLGDDQHALGVDGELEPWMTQLWTVLCERYPMDVEQERVMETYTIPPPLYQVTYVDADATHTTSTPIDPTPTSFAAVTLPPFTSGSSHYTPFASHARKHVVSNSSR